MMDLNTGKSGFIKGFSLAKVLEDDRQKRSNCDVAILVGDRTIYGHKLILEASIPYFRAMFNSGMKEESQKLITINGIDPDAFESLIKFIYTGNLEIGSRDFQRLLICANYLQFDKAVNVCCEYINMFQRYNTSFLDDWLIVTILISYFETDKHARAILLRNFSKLLSMSQFIQLTFEQLLGFISADQLQISSEVEVYKAVIKWIRADLEGRKAMLPKLFCQIRLHMIPVDCLIDHIEKNPLIKACDECRLIVDNVKNYHLIRRESFMKGLRLEDRKPER